MRPLAILALALALAGCGPDPVTPSAAQVESARQTGLVRLTKGNPEAPANLAELVALGRNVRAEEAKRKAY